MRMDAPVWGLMLLASAGLGCGREQRALAPTSAESATSGGVVVSELRPGNPPASVASTLEPDQTNAYAINEGKRLFDSYNCSGCHAHGGGSIGPALMDDRWIYGSEPANVFATIVEGRPNGMPSFRGKVPDFQVAQLVAYVRSLSALSGSKWSGGRNDSMMVKRPENRTSPARPVRDQGVPLP
jgi:cytochrome c oxidase cbb3-type subunit 3